MVKQCEVLESTNRLLNGHRSIIQITFRVHFPIRGFAKSGPNCINPTNPPSIYVLVRFSGGNPCDDITCEPWQECRIDRQSIPNCACPPPCEEVVRPVCGDDDQTYDNECELKRRSCMERRQVRMNYKGPCREYLRVVDTGHSEYFPLQ